MELGIRLRTQWTEAAQEWIETDQTVRTGMLDSWVLGPEGLRVESRELHELRELAAKYAAYIRNLADLVREEYERQELEEVKWGEQAARMGWVSLPDPERGKWRAKVDLLVRSTPERRPVPAATSHPSSTPARPSRLLAPLRAFGRLVRRLLGRR